MTGFEPDARDRGMAAERTDLAWNRSGLALLACGAFILRGIAGSDIPARYGAGLAVLSLGLAASLLGYWRGRRARRLGARPAGSRDLAPVSIGVALIGVAAAAVAMLAPS